MSADRIRQYRPADRQPYLDLYETVFGTDRSMRWFDWKYGANPYVDDPPIVVAYRDGELVGARSFFALQIAVDNGKSRLALQPSDAMVHPEHRREGIFSAMTDAALSYYADREPEFCFNFPNPKSLPGNLKLGWKVVCELPTYYRIQNPGELLDDTYWPVGTALRAASGAYNTFRSPSTVGSEIAVHRHTEPPVETLTTLATETDFEGLHAVRDSQFYRWRLQSPGQSYETYVADRATEPVAALVVGHGTENGVRVARIVDVLAVGDSDTRIDALEALLDAVLSDHTDVPLVAVRGGLPPQFLKRTGFLPDTAPPLSAITRTTTLVARPLGETGWTVGDTDIRTQENWSLNFIELDSC